MAVTEQHRWLSTGTTDLDTYRKSKNAPKGDDRDEAPVELTDDEKQELKKTKYLKQMLDAGVKARRPYETFDLAWDAYIGDHWPRGIASWRAKITMNKLRALCHFEQAVMTDNKPMFSVVPVVPGTDSTAKLLGKLSDREWDESDSQDKLALMVLYGLIFGTGVMKLGYDPRGAGGRGAHVTSPVAPYRIFVDPLATCVEDARFIIHVEMRSLGWIYENYPEKARAVRKMRGKRVMDDPNDARDFVREGSSSYKGGPASNNRENINADGIVTTIDYSVSRDPLNPSDGEKTDDWEELIEVAEFWYRDETKEPYQRPKRENGEIVYEDEMNDDGEIVLEPDGTYEVVNELTGLPLTMVRYKAKKRVVMEGWRRPKYPNGVLSVMAGPVLLCDIPNPYACDGFPFATFKNQDVGTFWGQSEILPLRDMQFAIERIASQVYDNLNLTGNPSWLVAKNSGINIETLRSRPGLTIPADDIDKAMKPLPVQQMPPQFMELMAALNKGIGEVSGLSDSMTAGAVPANTAFATVDTLQETSSAPLRQKTRNMERAIKRWGKIKLALIQQFDNGDRPLRDNDEEPESGSMWTPVFGGDDGEAVVGVVAPAKATEVRFQSYSNGDLQGQIEFGVKPDSSLSTSPSGLWNRYMQLYDKKLIDLQSFHEKFKLDDWQLIVQRLQAMSAAGGAKKKPGPAPAPGAIRKGNARPAAPSSSMASRHDLNATR